MSKRVFTNHKGIMAALKAAPAKGHIDFKHSTATGLKLRVYSTGRAAFVHRYTFNKRESFYRLPGIELKSGDSEQAISKVLSLAIVLHSQQRAELKAGSDPAIERDLQARAVAAMPTVSEFADTYIEMYAKVNKKSWASDERYLQTDVIPALGRLAMDKVKRAHVVALLDKKQQAGAMVSRNRLISLLSKFFNFAIERGLIAVNPASGIKRTTEQSKERALSADEIRLFWLATGDDSKLSPTVRLTLRLILVTGQRPGEVAQMHDSQIQGDLWTMADTKNGRAHTVPLSPLALQLIEEAQPHKRNGLLLPNTKGVIVGKSIISTAMRRLPWEDLPATAHDLRRTATTGISRLGFDRLLQNKIENHIDRTMGGIYDRHDYLPEKTQALKAWGNRLTEIITGQAFSNVIQFVAITG